MNIQALIAQLQNAPERLGFEQVMETIDTHYNYTPTRFSNGDLVNEAGSNEGSCKIFAFAKMHSLNQAQTLACFGRYYREDVLLNPAGDDHGNIRNFMRRGWEGVTFEGVALTPKG